MIKKHQSNLLLLIFLVTTISFNAQATLESEVKITDFGLHFNGSKVGASATNNGNSAPYNYFFGRNISAHGDCVKTYGKYVFLTWYKGDKTDRHVMLSRLNKETGVIVDIEFPHRHTGYQNKWWIGESHNTIAVAISPLDGTVHLLYDMHAYSNTLPSDGSLSNDYFRYSYSLKEVASLPDNEFTLDKFVQNTTGGYKHLSLNGGEDYNNFAALTYPQFFLNDSGDLFMYMRAGGNNNGAYKFSKYNASTSSWSSFTQFNILNAKNNGGDVNWGLYGNMKYVNGKIRVGFQRRANLTDKYLYQNGVYYAYSDNQNGLDQWKNHKGESFNLPLVDADITKVMEPGDYVETTQTDKISIVNGFDWTVTDQGDVHMISRVRDLQFGVVKYLHTYKPAGVADFITSEDFTGAESIYTSGNDIYVVGLQGGRVFVDKSAGGTNNFTRVYEATSGKTFDHGVVYIADDKIYYYLMENKTGSAQPLYLQIIDLGIVKDAFRITLNSPLDNNTYKTDEEIRLFANATDENGSITKVEFLIDNVLFGEATVAPYILNWTPDKAGTYTVQAIAHNNNNETVASTIVSVNVVLKDYTDLTGAIYRFKNAVTGKYLDSEGADVIASDSSEGIDKEWEIVKAGDYYNIESKTDRGILRAAASPEGEIINTIFTAPREDSDKQWTVIYESDGTYRFKTKTGDRFLVHQTNDLIEWTTTQDERTKWIAESTTLSTKNVVINPIGIKVYPNPTKDSFTIDISEIGKANVTIYNLLGKTIYKKTTASKRIQIVNNGSFKAGIYIIKVIGENQKSYNSKLVIK
jgi:hypothetical protein